MMLDEANETILALDDSFVAMPPEDHDFGIG